MRLQDPCFKKKKKNKHFHRVEECVEEKNIKLI